MSVFFESGKDKWSQMVKELGEWLSGHDVKVVDMGSDFTGHEALLLRSVVEKSRVSFDDMDKGVFRVDFEGGGTDLFVRIFRDRFDSYEVEENVFKVIMKDRTVFNFALRANY